MHHVSLVSFLSFHLGLLLVEKAEKRCLQTYNLSLLIKILAKGENYFPEVCHDSLMEELEFLMKKFHCESVKTLSHPGHAVSMCYMEETRAA